MKQAKKDRRKAQTSCVTPESSFRLIPEVPAMLLSFDKL